MPTTSAALITLVRAAVASTTGATALASDYLSAGEQERIPASGIRYQLQAHSVDVENKESASPMAQLFLTLLLHRRLGTSEAERTYTEGNMQTWISALVQPDYWRVLSTDIWGVTQFPQVSASDTKRVGDVISFTLTVALAYRT